MIGKTLAHYEISSLLGRGGMGEVYKAKDQKLGRDVAIKVLPEEFAKDTDRVARFKREAKLLASLNHPNIASIYGLEESEGTHFLVLELIEGDTLADQIKKGPIPAEESLKLALQIAEAFEAAHEKGVIHRDLKPANIKVTPEGKVKVLDFGLAKAFAPEQEEMILSDSPTLSAAATQKGVILGTAAYMSPEQAKGKSLDKRTDVWAFGCVLFEMLTGEAAFQGEDVTEILASVVKASVDLEVLPKNLHPRVREVVIRCLQKEQKKRYPEITQAQYEIEQVLADPSGVFVQPSVIAKPRRKLRLGIPWVAVAIALTAIIIGVVVWILKPADSPRVISFDYHLLEGQQFRRGWYGDYSIAVSPDHSHFVYATTEGLYIRSLDQLHARLISGTDGISMWPFFSPDGQWVGYLSPEENRLKKIVISGGAPTALCDVSDFNLAMWCKDNTIIYATNNDGIMRVSADGGTPETLIEAEEGSDYVSPQMLPDGKSVLFTIYQEDTPTVHVQSLESGERTELLEGEYPQYFPTGHIVYLLEDNIFAVPFDVDIHDVTGGSVSLVEGVANYDISNSGTLMYIAGTPASPIERALVWVDRNGEEEPLAAPPNNYYAPVISPDGTKVAMSIFDGNKSDIWIWDLLREGFYRLTSNESSGYPLWTLDGQRIVFWSGNDEKSAVYWNAADGSGDDELLVSVPDKTICPYCWSHDGKTLVTSDAAPQGLVFDIGSISMEDSYTYKPLLQKEYTLVNPQISPDGRWMAYMSNHSGQGEVYVRPFPEVNQRRITVSTNGGHNPLWSHDGRELFYINGTEIMAVAIKTEPTFTPGKPEVLFQYKHSTPLFDLRYWDLSPDGKRFLMRKRIETADEESTAESPRKINIILNWFEELKERVSTD